MARKSNLYQRESGRWTAYLRLNGEQVQKTFRARDEALLWLARMEQKRVLQDEVVLPKKITFADFAEEWLRDYARTHVSVRTFEGYEMSLRNHLIPYFGPLYLTQITRKKIDAFVADWAAGGPEFQERLRLTREREAARAQEQRRPLRPSRLGRSAGTVRNAFVPFREMLGHAVGWGYLEVNPAVRISLPTPEWQEEETIHALSGAQVEQLLAAAPADYRTVFMTAVTTGVRLGELRAQASAWASFEHCGGATWTGTVTSHVCMCGGRSRRAACSRSPRRPAPSGRSRSDRSWCRRSASTACAAGSRTRPTSSSRTRTAGRSTGTTW